MGLFCRIYDRSVRSNKYKTQYGVMGISGSEDISGSSEGFKNSLSTGADPDRHPGSLRKQGFPSAEVHPLRHRPKVLAYAIPRSRARSAPGDYHRVLRHDRGRCFTASVDLCVPEGYNFK